MVILGKEREWMMFGLGFRWDQCSESVVIICRMGKMGVLWVC